MATEVNSSMQHIDTGTAVEVCTRRLTATAAGTYALRAAVPAGSTYYVTRMTIYTVAGCENLPIVAVYSGTVAAGQLVWSRTITQAAATELFTEAAAQGPHSWLFPVAGGDVMEFSTSAIMANDDDLMVQVSGFLDGPAA